MPPLRSAVLVCRTINGSKQAKQRFIQAWSINGLVFRNLLSHPQDPHAPSHLRSSSAGPGKIQKTTEVKVTSTHQPAPTGAEIRYVRYLRSSIPVAYASLPKKV
jgi:hypothetical protein